MEHWGGQKKYRLPLPLSLLLLLSLFQFEPVRAQFDNNLAPCWGTYLSTERPTLAPSWNDGCAFATVTSVVQKPMNYSRYVNGQYEVSEILYTAVNGTFGWCATKTYPNYNDYTDFINPPAGGLSHEMELVMPIPWCVSTLVYSGCLTPRVDRWSRPSIIYHDRPLRNSVCASSPYSSGLMPVYYTMWDVGDYYAGTVTLRMDDSCEAANTAENGYNVPAVPVVNFFWQSNEASSFATYDNADSTAGHYAWSAYTSSTYEYLANFSWYYPHDRATIACRDDCPNMPRIKCPATRTRPLNIFHPRIQLVCHDPTWGYVWRVDHTDGPGLHFDWSIRERYVGEARYYDHNLEQYVSYIRQYNSKIYELSVPPPWDYYIRYPYHQNYHNNPRDSNPSPPVLDTSTHDAAPLSTFYIPTFTTNASHNYWISIYAGTPNYYVGTVIQAAFNDFYDTHTLFSMDMLRTSTTLNFNTTIDPLVRFPEDYPRQVLITMCNNGTFRYEVQQLLPSYNIYGFCNAYAYSNTLSFDEFRAALVNTLNYPTLASPIPTTCNCNSYPSIPCRIGTAPMYEPVKFMYDYDWGAPPAPINLEVRAVCRLQTPLAGVKNLPPLPNLTNTGNVTADITTIEGVTNLVPPIWRKVVGSTTLLTYSTAPLGVVWKISNMNDPADYEDGPRIRWAFGNYPTGGYINNYTVPYIESQTIMTVLPGKVRWIMSRSLFQQRLVMNINLECKSGTDSTCNYLVPTDPPDPTVVTSSRKYNLINPLALPLCECYNNFPCASGKFLPETNVTTVLSSLPPPPIDVITNADTVTFNASCTPYLEVCNGLDDNCNGLIDDIPGRGLPCGSFTRGNCHQGVIDCLFDQVICANEVIPERERCTLGDYDCDNIQQNPPELGQTCGNLTGACRPGTYTCTPNSIYPVCTGGIQPTPEICDGIDNDCNGLVDDNCTLNPVPPPPPPPPVINLPPITLPPIPAAPFPPIPPLTSPMGIVQWLLALVNIPLPSFSAFNPIALLLLFLVLVITLATCCSRAERESGFKITAPYKERRLDERVLPEEPIVTKQQQRPRRMSLDDSKRKAQ